MSEFRLSPEAEAELDDIWLHIARESGSIDVATRVIEKVTEHFWLLAPVSVPWPCARRGSAPRLAELPR